MISSSSWIFEIDFIYAALDRTIAGKFSRYPISVHAGFFFG